MSGGGRRGETRVRTTPEPKQAGGTHNRKARRAMQSKRVLVQPDGSPIPNPLGADLSIPIDHRRPITWRGFEFTSGPSDSGDSAALAIERAVDGLVKQQDLARKTLAKIALRDDD